REHARGHDPYREERRFDLRRGAARRRPRLPRRCRRPHGPRPEGRNDHRRRPHWRLFRVHDAARPHDRARRRGQEPRRLDVRRDDLRRWEDRQPGRGRHPGRQDRPRNRVARAKARSLRPEGAQRREESAENRRRQTAVELRQSRADRKEARPLRETMATEPKKLPALLPDVATRPKRNTSILGHSKIFTPEVIDDIHIKSELGRYRMRGFSLFKKIPHWDDLTFLPGTLTRFVIEGYREKCETKTIIGPKAKRPMVLDIPVYVTGMSFGALSYEAKIALARGATMAGSATCSGEGGMIPDERRYSMKW